jgi:hypothetical protein
MIRKIVHNNLNIKAASTYVPYQELENKAMLVGFLDSPDLFTDHIRRYTNSLTTQMIFGFRTISIDDPKLKQLYSVSSSISKNLLLIYLTTLSLGIREVLRNFGQDNSCPSRSLPSTQSIT